MSPSPGYPEANRPRVALVPVSALDCGSTWISPSPWVWIPIRFVGWGRLAWILPQMSKATASCQWSVKVGGVAGGRWLRSYRLNATAVTPSTTTTAMVVYHPTGVLPRLDRPPPVAAALATFLPAEALPMVGDQSSGDRWGG